MVAKLCEECHENGETHYICSTCGDAWATKTRADNCKCINEPKDLTTTKIRVIENGKRN